MGDCVREMTIREELENLDLDQHDRDRILRKYDDERNCEKERNYQYSRELEEKLIQKDTEIKALTGYIRFKGL